MVWMTFHLPKDMDMVLRTRVMKKKKKRKKLQKIRNQRKKYG